MSDLDSSQWIDSEEIRQAIYRYCAAIDRCQYHWMERVFHPDATILVGTYDGDTAGFIRMLEQRRDTVVRAAHMIGNILLDRISDDLVFSEAYCLAVEQMPSSEPGGEDFDRTVRLRYADAFRRRDGVWRSERRIVVVDHAMAPVPSAKVAQFRGPRGMRDADDPAMRMRAALGVA